MIGSVVPAYNIPGIAKGLKFTGPVLADIFQGKITKWNDPQIKALNPGVNLPDGNIVVVHRSDGSGATYVWTSYLSSQSPLWNQTVGASKSVPWPTGIGAPGNEGVSNAIKGSPNTIGYVELNYALTTGIPYGFVKNSAGKFIEPSLNSALEDVSNTVATKSLPAGDQSWSRVSLLNAPGPNSYPVTSFTYLLLPKDLSTNSSIDQTKAKALDFISWAVRSGQADASRSNKECSRHTKVNDVQRNFFVYRVIKIRNWSDLFIRLRELSLKLFGGYSILVSFFIFYCL